MKIINATGSPLPLGNLLPVSYWGHQQENATFEDGPGWAVAWTDYDRVLGPWVKCEGEGGIPEQSGDTYYVVSPLVAIFEGGRTDLLLINRENRLVRAEFGIMASQLAGLCPAVENYARRGMQS